VGERIKMEVKGIVSLGLFTAWRWVVARTLLPKFWSIDGPGGWKLNAAGGR